MKIVINKCYGGFGLSPQALVWLYIKGYDGKDFKYPIKDWYIGPKKDTNLKEDLSKWHEYLKTDKLPSFWNTVFTPEEDAILIGSYIKRTEPLLIECVETLKEKANGGCAKLEIIEIPDCIDWEIEEYDGYKSVHEAHRIWG